MRDKLINEKPRCSLRLLIALLIGEAITRILLDPVDFLKPRLVDDPAMGSKIAPYSRGTTGGDSETSLCPRGPISLRSVTRSPMAYPEGDRSLARGTTKASRQECYYYRLGGYGPAQYFRLLTEQAVKLRPAYVITGFFYEGMISGINIIVCTDESLGANERAIAYR